MSTSCCAKWKPHVAMIAISLAFAIVNVLLKKVLDGGTNHTVVVTYRLCLAVVFLAPIACYKEWQSIVKITARTLCQLFFSALIGVTLTQYLFLLGLGYTSATFSCAFLNMVPVLTFLLALPFRLEKVNVKSKAGRAKILGAFICMSGAIILTLYKGIPLMKPHSQAMSGSISHSGAMVSANKTKKWFLGSILLVAGTIAWSSWFLIQALIGKKFPCQYSSTVILSFFGAIQSGILTMITDRSIAVWIFKGKLEIFSIAYAGLIGSALCYVGMLWCVKQKGPVFTSAFSPLIQIFAAMFDSSILHEQIYLGSVIGSILVVTGLYALFWGKSNGSENIPLVMAVKQSQVDTEAKNCDAA